MMTVSVSDLLKSMGETPNTLAPMLDWHCGHLFLCEKAKGPIFFPNLGKGQVNNKHVKNKHEGANYPLRDRVVATVMRLNARTQEHLSTIAQNLAGFLIQIIDENLLHGGRGLGHVDNVKQKLLLLCQSHLRKLVKKLSPSEFSWSWILSAFSIALDEIRSTSSGSASTRYGLAVASSVEVCAEIRVFRIFWWNSPGQSTDSY